MNTELTDAQRADIRQMARDSADKDGVLTDFDKDQIAAMKKDPPPAQSMPNSCSRIVPGNAQDCPKAQSAETQADCQPIEIQGSDGGRDRD